MKKSRFTETQIVKILKEADAGVAAEDLSRQHGFSKSTFYKWRARYGGIVKDPKLVPLRYVLPEAEKRHPFWFYICILNYISSQIALDCFSMYPSLFMRVAGGMHTRSFEHVFNLGKQYK